MDFKVWEDLFNWILAGRLVQTHISGEEIMDKLRHANNVKTAALCQIWSQIQTMSPFLHQFENKIPLTN